MKYKVGDILSNDSEIFEIIYIENGSYTLKYIHESHPSFTAPIEWLDKYENLELDIIYKKKKLFKKEVENIISSQIIGQNHE